VTALWPVFRVSVGTVAVTVTAYFDPSVPIPAPNWVPNPDDILTNVTNPALKSSSHPLQLSAGQELALTFAISV